MNEQQIAVDQEKKDELQRIIEEFVQTYLRRHKYNYLGNWIIVLIGLLLAGAVTVAGIYDKGTIAAVLGVCTAIAIGAQKAFPIGERAEFYRLVVAEGRNLTDDLKFRVKTEPEFQTLLNKWQKLRTHAAASLPRGKEMEAIKDMSADLSKTVNEGQSSI